LAITALNHFLIEPGFLHLGAHFGRADTLDCSDIAAANRVDRQKTRAHRIAVDCTVQAPHWAAPHPYFVPVMPSTSRNTQSSGVSPPTSTSCLVPLTLIEKVMAFS
jgi:hypothetical protein